MPVGLSERQEAAVGAAIVVAIGADGEIGFAIAIKITEGGDGPRKLGGYAGMLGEISRGHADFLVGFDGAVGI